MPRNRRGGQQCRRGHRQQQKTAAPRGTLRPHAHLGVLFGLTTWSGPVRNHAAIDRACGSSGWWVGECHLSSVGQSVSQARTTRTTWGGSSSCKQPERVGHKQRLRDSKQCHRTTTVCVVVLHGPVKSIHVFDAGGASGKWTGAQSNVRNKMSSAKQNKKEWLTDKDKERNAIWCQDFFRAGCSVRNMRGICRDRCRMRLSFNVNVGAHSKSRWDMHGPLSFVQSAVVQPAVQAGQGHTTFFPIVVANHIKAL